jgi:hypothetical protein
MNGLGLAAPVVSDPASVVTIAKIFSQRSRNHPGGSDKQDFAVVTAAALTAVMAAAMNPHDISWRYPARTAYASFMFAEQTALAPQAALTAIAGQKILAGTGPLLPVVQFLTTVLVDLVH